MLFVRAIGCAVGVLTIGGCCGGAPCALPSSDVVKVDGFVIVSAKSRCSGVNVSKELVSAGGFVVPTTCHFEVTLDDGQHIELDVAFDKETKVNCCGTITRYLATAAPLVITAPPGYVPHVDAGFIPSGDASSDSGVSDAALE